MLYLLVISSQGTGFGGVPLLFAAFFVGLGLLPSIALWLKGFAAGLLAAGDLGAAESHLNKALESCLLNDLETERNRVLLGMAELHLNRGDYERAGRLAHDATREAERAGLEPTAGEGHAALGRIRAKSGDDSGADREFAQALRIFTRLAEAEWLVETHHAYAQVLKERGDPAGALEQMEAAIAITRPALARPAAKPAAGRGVNPA